MTDTAVQRATSDKTSRRRSPGPEQLMAEVEERRTQLATTIDTLLQRTSPAALGDQAKHQVRDYFVTPEGEPRREALTKVGIVLGCALGGVTVLWLLRRKFHR